MKTETDVVGLLARLTGSLRAARGTRPEALERARRVLASAPLEGDSAALLRAHVGELSPAASAALQRIAAEASASERDEALHVRGRRWPPAPESFDAPAQLLADHGQVVESLGPFETDDFDLIWFDLFYDVDFASVVDAGTGASLILIPRTSVSLLIGSTEISHAALGPGTVWLRANALHPSAPTNGYAGLRIREGSLRLSQPAQVVGGALRATPGTVVTLQLSLVSAPSPPASPHGGDARDLRVDTPAAATFILQVGGAGRLSSADSGRLEVYTSRIELAHQSAIAEYDADFRRLCFGVSPTPAVLESADPGSQLFMPRGEARIARASWALPIAVASSGNPASLGEVSGCGGYMLTLDPGLTAKFEPWGMHADQVLSSASLLTESGVLYLRARANVSLRRELQLWRADAAASRLELSARDEVLFQLLALAGPNGGEMLSVERVQCRAHLDRPIDATGAKPQFHSDRARIVLTSRAGELRIHVSAPADAPRDPVSGAAQVQRDASFVLNNALVRASPAAQLTLSGPLTDRRSVHSGVLQLQFATRFVLPTLPDPYAANISRYAPRRGLPLSERSAGDLIASVRWSSPETPVIAFELREAEAALARAFLPITPAPIELFARFDRLALIESHFARTGGQGPEVFRLLDVSSRADLFGVGFNPVGRERRAGAAALTLSGLDLAAPVHDVSAFTLPAFQWEPVYNLSNPDALAGFPDKLVSPTDGGATRIATSSASIVALAPIPLISKLLDEYGEPGSVLGARFTLPFGIVASARLETPQQPAVHELPQFTSTTPAFTASGMSGGLQVTLTAAEPSPLQPAGAPRALPGLAIQTNNAGGWNVLKSASIDDMFNDAFANMTPMAPVERIDFSGYGATTFSDWRRTSSQATGVTQVKFEAVVGRTSKEVVQVRSRLYPWAAIVVRIITMSRTGSAGVFRRDSGWQAASDGDYNLPGCIVHRGVAPRLTNIRRIRDTTNTYERVYGGELVKLVGVLFDADVEVEGVTLGANGEGRVPARDIAGYVQVSPTDGSGNLTPLSVEQLSDLLQQTGAIGGPLDCELNIAQSGTHMRLSRLEVDRTETLGGGAQFAAVVRGAAELPLAGQWTFVYRRYDQQDFGPLEPSRPIPLIRANAVAGAPAPPCRFADPSELHRLTHPKSEYAVLWSGDAQRLLAPQPQLRFAEPVLHAGSALLFADMYALAMGGVAMFPRGDLTNPMPAGSTLRFTGRRRVRLEIPPQPGLAAGQFSLAAAERTMSQSAAFRFRSRLHSNSTARLTIDSDQTPNWSCTIGPVSSLGDIAGLKELLQVQGDLTSSAASAPQLANPRMIFGGPLAPVQKVLQFLAAFGFSFPFDIAITNAKYGFKSGWKYVFPKYGPEKLIADLGRLSEIELLGRWGIESEVAKDINKIVAEHSIVSTKGTSKAALRGWHFNLEASAECLSPVGSLFEVIKLNAGGIFKFELSGEEGGATRLSYLFAVAWEGEVEVGVLTFTGQRSYGIVFRHLIEKEQLEIGGASEWELEAEFLKGLAAAKVSFELIALVYRTDGIHFKGEGTLAIDVTVGWVLSKEYEVEFHVDETLAAAVFIANTILP